MRGGENTMQLDSNYNFPVELQPIYFGDNLEIKDKKAVIRTDTNTPLGVVSNGYGLVNHAAVVDAFREAGKKYNIKEQIALTNDGRDLYYKMLFPKVEMTVAKGDVVQMALTIKNSYSGHGSLAIIFQAMRLVCLNGMVIGSKFLQFNYRHMGEVGGFANKDMIEGASAAFKHHIKMFGEKTPVISQMAKTEFLPSDTYFNTDFVKMPEYLLDVAQEKFENEQMLSVWGYYNSLTYAITHKQKKEEAANPKQIIRQGVAAWSAAESLI